MHLRPLAACAAVLAVLAAAPVSASDAPQVSLYAMDCGRISMKDAGGYADDGSYDGVAAELVIPCFLIRHPRGDLLWETGVPQALADQPPQAGDEVVTVRRKLTDQLAELGLQPADIEFLSVSHSHFDHLGNAGLFAASTWIVDSDERAHAFRPAKRAAAEEFAAYAALENARTTLIESDQPHDVFGDGSVVIHAAPGHTPGHTVLLVRLAQAGPVLLSGDLWHLPRSREARLVPRFNSNRAQTLASMDRVEALARDTNARVVRQHVPSDFEALPLFPGALR